VFNKYKGISIKSPIVLSKEFGGGKMLMWIVDFVKCFFRGHCLKGCGNYMYCLRCGHLEVKKDVFVTITGAKADDSQAAYPG